MKKSKHLKEIAMLPVKNPVAKHARQFNKSKVYADKSKYRRKAKHVRQEAFPIVLLGPIGNAFC